jgi:hypothetical protein
VFIKGSFGSEKHHYHFSDLLLKATTQFTEAKDEKEDIITMQQFYDDIIQKFTRFLMDNPEYKVILDTLFEDSAPLKRKNRKNGHAKEPTEQP